MKDIGFYIDGESFKLRDYERDTNFVIENDIDGSEPYVEVRGGYIDLNEEHRRLLIKWLASRTSGVHVIECEHA